MTTARTEARTPGGEQAPGPIATIVLAALVGVAGAVAVIVLDSAVADVIGVLALACGLAAVLWAVLRVANDSGFSG
jgi:hypothetical protein